MERRYVEIGVESIYALKRSMKVFFGDMTRLPVRQNLVVRHFLLAPPVVPYTLNPTS
jgi:hypothetical protein